MKTSILFQNINVLIRGIMILVFKCILMSLQRMQKMRIILWEISYLHVVKRMMKVSLK